MFRLLTPHLVAENVLELSVARLRELEIDALLLDVDCTLKRYRSQAVSEEVAAWLTALREAGVGVCLLSNGKGKRIQEFAQRLNIPFIANACKPLPHGCRRAVAQMGFDRKRTAVVGDQVFTDVMAARAAGLRSILVRPIHPEEEPWYTRLKRPLERLVMRRISPRNRLR